MNKMTVIAALAALAGAGALHAQSTQPQQPREHAQGERGPGRRGGMDAMLLKGITLTDAQKAKLQELHQAERAKRQANGQDRQRGDFQAIRDARQKGDTATANRLMRDARVKMEARRDEQIKKLRAFLTPDQAKQLDANIAEMKQHQGEFRGRGEWNGANHQGAARPGAGGR